MKMKKNMTQKHLNLESGFSLLSKTFIVAELSANHAGSIKIAIDTIKAASKAGADAIKLQTYTPDSLTIDCNNEFFQIKGTLWNGNSLYRLYEKAQTPWHWHKKLKKVAEDLGLIFFSTPFDFNSVDFLEELDVPIYKIASFELVDYYLLEKIAATKKPVIMSTGMATLSEIDEAVKVLRDNGTKDLALLKCTSAYPSPYEEIHLKTLPHIAKTFKVTVGLSDHSQGIAVPIAAVALGAKIIEKHFILSRDIPSPDAPFSLEPKEFSQMVDAIRATEKALGEINYELTNKQKENRVFRRSLFVVEDMKKGERFSYRNVKSIRPGYGLPPKYLSVIIGKKARRAISRGTPLSWDLIN